MSLYTGVAKSDKIRSLWFSPLPPTWSPETPVNSRSVERDTEVPVEPGKGTVTLERKEKREGRLSYPSFPGRLKSPDSVLPRSHPPRPRGPGHLSQVRHFSVFVTVGLGLVIEV